MATALTCAQVNDYLARNDSLFGPYIYNATREPGEPLPSGTSQTLCNHRRRMRLLAPLTENLNSRLPSFLPVAQTTLRARFPRRSQSP